MQKSSNSSYFNLDWFLLSFIAWILGKALLETFVVDYGWPPKMTFSFNLIAMVAVPCMFTNFVQGLLLKKMYNVPLLWWMGLTLVGCIFVVITSLTHVVVVYIVILLLQWVLLNRYLEDVHWWIMVNLLTPLTLGIIHFVNMLTDWDVIAEGEYYDRFLTEGGSKSVLYAFMAAAFALCTMYSLRFLKPKQR